MHDGILQTGVHRYPKLQPPVSEVAEPLKRTRFEDHPSFLAGAPSKRETAAGSTIRSCLKTTACDAPPISEVAALTTPISRNASAPPLPHRHRASAALAGMPRDRTPTKRSKKDALLSPAMYEKSLSLVPDLIGLRLAPATRKSYEAGWRHWESWCRHVKPPLGPVFRATDDPVLIEDVILSFIVTEVSYHGNGWGAASTKLNAVCDYHLRHFNLSLRDHFNRVPLVQETLAAEAKRLRTPKLPVRMPMLKYLRSTFTLDIFEHALAWAAIVIAFFGQLRVGQYATASAPDTDAHARVFRDGDIVLFDTHEDLVRWDTCSPAVLDTATEFGFVLRSGKTDQTGDGAVKTIGRSGTDVCVVQAIQALIMARRHVRIEYSSEQLFLRRPYQPGKKRGKLPTSFSPKEVANVLKSAAVARGEDPNNYGTHSCRSGGRSTQAAAGVSRDYSKQLGGWSANSDCDLLYAFPSRELGKSVPALMVDTNDDNDAQLRDLLLERRAVQQSRTSNASRLRNLINGNQ